MRNFRNLLLISNLQLVESKVFLVFSFFSKWILLNRTPTSTQLHSLSVSSTHLHAAPSTSIQLILTSTQLSSTPSALLESKTECSWAIFPNLGHKIQTGPFWLKICIHGILKALTPNPDWEFWNIDHRKIFFGQIWAEKVRNVCFARKLTHTVSRGCWFLFGHYFSEVSNPDSILGKLGPKKFKVVRFAWKLARRVSRGCWFLFQH